MNLLYVGDFKAISNSFERSHPTCDVELKRNRKRKGCGCLQTYMKLSKVR